MIEVRLIHLSEMLRYLAAGWHLANRALEYPVQWAYGRLYVWKAVRPSKAERW